jgi:hypothetical protein
MPRNDSGTIMLYTRAWIRVVTQPRSLNPHRRSIDGSDRVVQMTGALA